MNCRSSPGCAGSGCWRAGARPRPPATISSISSCGGLGRIPLPTGAWAPPVPLRAPTSPATPKPNSDAITDDSNGYPPNPRLAHTTEIFTNPLPPAKPITGNSRTGLPERSVMKESTIDISGVSSGGRGIAPRREVEAATPVLRHKGCSGCHPLELGNSRCANGQHAGLGGHPVPPVSCLLATPDSPFQAAELPAREPEILVATTDFRNKHRRHGARR